MYSLDFVVTTSTCDADGKLQFFSALQMMQDCSEMWLESEPTVARYFTENQMTQLLAARQVEVVRVPRFRERLRVTTSVYEVKPMFGFRNTFIYDANGEPCYRSWSMGAFVYMTSGRLSRIDNDVINSVTIEEKLPMTYGDRRIHINAPLQWMPEPIRVQRCDIDYNRHVNNAVYVRIAQDLLPDGFCIGAMLVEYRRPARYGETLQPYVYHIGQTIVIQMKVGTDECCLIEFTPTEE